MTGGIYRFAFHEDAAFSDVRDSLFVAIYAAEGLFGRAQVQLETGIWIDEKAHSCVIDAATEVGISVAKIFTCLVQRQFGEDGFKIDRVVEPPASAPLDTAAA
jgi:hypothetical protein